jgi:hypothetical protein
VPRAFERSESRMSFERHFRGVRLRSARHLAILSNSFDYERCALMNVPTRTKAAFDAKRKQIAHLKVAAHDSEDFID